MHKSVIYIQADCRSKAKVYCSLFVDALEEAGLIINNLGISDDGTFDTSVHIDAEEASIFIKLD